MKTFLTKIKDRSPQLDGEYDTDRGLLFYNLETNHFQDKDGYKENPDWWLEEIELNEEKILAKEEAINFMKWMFDQHYMHERLINSEGKFWVKQYTNPPVPLSMKEKFTEEQLYDKFVKTQG